MKTERERQLEGALTALVEEYCDYMLINHLGDPEQQHNIIRAREALAYEDADGGDEKCGDDARLDKHLIERGAIPDWSSPYYTPPQQRDALEAFHRIITWSNEDYHHDGMHSRQADTKTVRRALTIPAVPEAINVVFDGPPGPTAGRFIEVETDNGESVRVGEWIERDDGLWALRIDRALAQSGEGRVPEGWRDKLWAIHGALDAALGDSDVDWIESDEELRDEEPVQWAAKELAGLLAAAPEPGPEKDDDTYQ